MLRRNRRYDFWAIFTNYFSFLLDIGINYPRKRAGGHELEWILSSYLSISPNNFIIFWTHLTVFDPNIVPKWKLIHIIHIRLIKINYVIVILKILFLILLLTTRRRIVINKKNIEGPMRLWDLTLVDVGRRDNKKKTR